MKHLVLSSLLISSTAVAAPDPWCGKAAGKLEVRITSGDDFKIEDTDPDAVVKIANALCTTKGDDTMDGQTAHKFHGELEAARDRWSKRLGMTDDDWPDAVEYGRVMTSTRSMGTIDIDLSHRAYADLTPIEQYAAMRTHAGASGSPLLDHDYIADALGAKLTEAGRVGYLSECYASSSPVRWAKCQGDADALDMTKLAVELRGDANHTGAQRMTIRMMADQVRAKSPKQEPKPMFDVAAAARKDWAAHARDYAAALAALDELDGLIAQNATEQKFEGCLDKTRTAFSAAVSTVPAKDFASLPKFKEGTGDDESLSSRAVAIAMRHPLVYLTAAAYVECANNTHGGNALTSTLADYIRSNPGYRGPRNAVMSAIMIAGIEFEHRRIDRIEREWFTRGSAHVGSHRGGSGVVGKVATKGDTAHVEFRAVMETIHPCTRWETTNRILQITPQGNFIYEQNCLASTTEKHNIASPPMDLDATLAKGLKPGMLVLVQDGIAVAAWANPDAKQPAIVLGAPVK